MAQFCYRLIFRQLIVFTLLFLSFQNTWSKDSEGKESGGGGGVIHDQFIAYGYRILYFLRHDPAGQQIVKSQKLNLCRLKGTLLENFVHVSNLPRDKFVDVRGSQIDAYTYPWRIELQKDVWSQYFESQRDIYNLIFKEMLRSEGTYFSDAIFISNQILPFPEKYKVSQSLSVLPHNAEFQSWIKEDGRCIYKKDIEIFRARRDSNFILLENEPPLCKRVDETDKGLEPTSESPYEFLVRKSKLEGCMIQPEPCRIITTNEKLENKSQKYYRSIVRGGQPMYVAPHSIITSDGVQQFYKPVDSRFDVKSMFIQLVNSGFCVAGADH